MSYLKTRNTKFSQNPFLNVEITCQDDHASFPALVTRCLNCYSRICNSVVIAVLTCDQAFFFFRWPLRREKNNAWSQVIAVFPGFASLLSYQNSTTHVNRRKARSSPDMGHFWIQIINAGLHHGRAHRSSTLKLGNLSELWVMQAAILWLSGLVTGTPCGFPGQDFESRLECEFPCHACRLSYVVACITVLELYWL